MAPMVTETVSLRTTLSQVRRIWQRGQSLHRTGHTGRGSDGFSGGSDPFEAGAAVTASWEERGQNTALTRRGLVVERLSCDFARRGQARQSRMRAAYNRRYEPSRSGLRSCG